MENCSNCSILQKQVEDLKQRHLVDFRTIKQKIISTDTLIRSYEEKCQEYDKQKLYVLELASKLDGAQRSVEVIKLQLKKSLELKEPLQKKCHELEKERVHQCTQIESLQDRVKGSENLVTQLQSFIKENEMSKNSMILEASFNTDQIEEMKKRQKKNKTQINKLSNQLLAEKKTNKALSVELTRSQNQIKTLLDEAEQSKKLVLKLQEQLNAGQTDHCAEQRSILLETQMTQIAEYQKIIKQLKDEAHEKAKQANSDEDKNPSYNKTKSPVTPDRSPRKRKNVSPKLEQSSTVSEQERPLTRLQQKNLIVEIEKKSRHLKSPENISAQQHESEKELEVGTLPDVISKMCDAPYYPSLSPLPPSPFWDGHSFGENTSDENDDPENGDFNDVSDNTSDIERDCDRLTDLEKNGCKKRELEQFCGMSLRSGKKRKNGSSGDEMNNVNTLRKTKSVDMKLLRDKSDVPVLEVKERRRRTKQKLPRNDGDHEQSFESSDTSTLETNPADTSKKSLDHGGKIVVDSDKLSSDILTVENNVVDSSEQSSNNSTSENNVLHSRTTCSGAATITKRQFSDTEIAGNIVVDTTKYFPSSSEEDVYKEKEDNDIFPETPRRPQTRSMDKLDKRDVVNESVCFEISPRDKDFTATSQTLRVTQDAGLDEWIQPEMTTEEKEAKLKESENVGTTTAPVIGRQSWIQSPPDELCVQERKAKSEEQGFTDHKRPSTQNELDNKCSENTPVLDQNAAETNCRDDILRDITAEDVKSAEGLTTFAGVITPTKVPDESSISLDEQLEAISTPLSPIPDTPKRRCRSIQIPCFDSLDHLPLSPIPPSPPPSVPPTSPPNSLSPSKTVDVGGDSVSNKLTSAESLGSSAEQDVQVGKKQNVKKNELPANALLRYPGVNEMQFTVFIFTKLKNKEITLEDLVAAFSVRKNVRNQTPISNGLVSVLKLAKEGDEQVLMEKYTELYKHEYENTNQPIVSEFEMQVLIALNRLSNIQRHSSLLKKVVKLIGINLCQLFANEKNDAGVLSMCRIYTGICRLIGEGSHVRVLCFDIVKQNKRYSLTERMILSIAFVWPHVLGKDLHCVTLHTEAVTISGCYSFLATLQIILMSREISCEESRQCLQRRCGWSDVSRDGGVLEWLARDLVRVLHVTSEMTPQDGAECNPISNQVFETIKSLELLAVVMGWKWTNDTLIRELLWSVFKDWKMKGFDSNEETSSNGKNKTFEHVLKVKETGSSLESGTVYEDNSLVPNNVAVDCPSNEPAHLVRTEMNINAPDTKTRSNKLVEINHDHNMDITIQNILRLFGVLGYERLQNGEMIHLDAVITLLCAIVNSPDCEKVSFRVQLSSAHALLDLISADPMKIIHVLGEWIERCSKINDISTAEFERRMKDVRTHLWTK